MGTKFKIGDKIKVVGRVWWVDKYYTNKVGTVTKVVTDEGFPYIVGIDTVKIPVHGHEIEKVTTKGQQLLFSFME